MCTIPRKIARKNFKKGKKGQDILKFVQKCKKIGNTLKKGRWLRAIIALLKTAKKGPDNVQFFLFLLCFVLHSLSLSLC